MRRSLFIVALVALILGSSACSNPFASDTPKDDSRIAVTIIDGPTAAAQDVEINLGDLESWALGVVATNLTDDEVEVSLGIDKIDDTTLTNQVAAGGSISVNRKRHAYHEGIMHVTLVPGKYHIMLDGKPTDVVITVTRSSGSE